MSQNLKSFTFSKFRRPTYDLGCKIIEFPGQENIFEHIKNVNLLPNDLWYMLPKISLNLENRIWYTLSFDFYTYLHNYYKLDETQKRKLKRKLKSKNKHYTYLDKIKHTETVEKLYKACLLYYFYTTLDKKNLSKKSLFFTKDGSIMKFLFKKHYNIYYDDMSYVCINLNDKSRYYVKFVDKKEMELVKKISSLYNEKYKLYGFDILVIKDYKSLNELVLNSFSFNTITRSFKVDIYHLVVDILGLMKNYQNLGVHNSITPEKISYNGKNYYINDFSDFNNDKKEHGFLRKKFDKIWSSQTRYYGCISTIKNDLLELGFIINWIKIKEIIGLNSFRYKIEPITKNVKSYFDYICNIPKITIDDSMILAIGKFLRRLDKPINCVVQKYKNVLE